MISRSYLTSFSFVLVLGLTSSQAQRDLKDIPDPSPALQQASFHLAEGFEINLFASDPMIAKPVQMNWDGQGRLWMVSSKLYPHLAPGQGESDEVLILEDQDGDGVADKKTVFTDDLLIPTGVLPADGGAYVANSTEVLFMRDNDGDGRADQRDVVFSGFGTEDTHHIIHTFRSGVEGMIYFNQSIYIHSHVETPWGVRRLLGGGIWHFRPETRQLEVYCKGFVNPWGHVFDPWGQSFVTDGAYGEGINYVFPGSVWVTSPDAKRIMQGLNPGQPKHCSLLRLSGRHLPPEMEGQLVTNDFRGHRVNRFVVSEDGSGYASRQIEDLVWTTHAAFRPIDVQMGPDGAIYIADWYNPIIQHGEVDFRDERRDQSRGRIWRITAKGRPLVARPKIASASPEALLALLKAPEDLTRDLAKRALRDLGADKVLKPLQAWVNGLTPNDAGFEHFRLEAFWVYQGMNQLPNDLLRDVLASKDHHVRAAAVRALYHWHADVPDAFSLLKTAVADEHPQVRLEAVNALRQLGSAEAFVAAMSALKLPIDKNLDFALWLTAREMESQWLPPFQAGSLALEPAQVQFALRAIENPAALKPLIAEYQRGSLSGKALNDTLSLAADLGAPEDLAEIATVVFSSASPLAARRAGLEALCRAGRTRQVVPSGDVSAIGALLDGPFADLAAEAVGLWKLEALRSRLEQSPAEAALKGIALLGGEASVAFLEKAAAEGTAERRAKAIVALTDIDVVQGARLAAVWLGGEAADTGEANGLYSAFLARKDGPSALAKALEGKRLSREIAYLGLQRANASGASAKQLIEALSKAADLEPINQALEGEPLARLLEEVKTQGDPHRGESVYRRASLQCMTCHALGGAGGNIGPDMISLGSSAPVDYIVESLLNPSAKVKEGFHLTVVTTKDGGVVSGFVAREDERQLIIRDAAGVETPVQKSAIAGKEVAPVSLMPAGLTASLRRDEFVDLVRFLSELGKEGDFKIAPERLVRRWRGFNFESPGIEEAIRQGDQRFFAQPDEMKEWLPVYSEVSGRLPLQEVPSTRRWLFEITPVHFELRATTAGDVGLRLNAVAGVRLWLGVDEIVAKDGVFVLPLTSGQHMVTLVLNRDQFPEATLRAELIDLPGSAAQAQIVSGP